MTMTRRPASMRAKLARHTREFQSAFMRAGLTHRRPVTSLGARGAFAPRRSGSGPGVFTGRSAPLLAESVLSTCCVESVGTSAHGLSARIFVDFSRRLAIIVIIVNFSSTPLHQLSELSLRAFSLRISVLFADPRYGTHLPSLSIRK